MTSTAPQRTGNATAPGGRAQALARAARPTQWLKNLLVIAAPATAGVLDEPTAVLDTALAFAAFSLAASGTYLVNDARDRLADRAHPRKKDRPVATGALSLPVAYAGGATGLALGVAVAFAGSRQLALVVASYVVLSTAYSLWLKHVVILDMVGVAGGFVLRAVAGAAAVEVQVSTWFLIVATLGSLFVVAGKREAELRNTDRGESRAILELYTPGFLRYVRATTSGALLVSYCLWALDVHSGPARVAFGLSIVPFAVGILRYAMLVDAGHGEVPEQLVLSDRMLLVCGLLVVAALAVGVYAV